MCSCQQGNSVNNLVSLEEAPASEAAQAQRQARHRGDLSRMPGHVSPALWTHGDCQLSVV